MQGSLFAPEFAAPPADTPPSIDDSSAAFSGRIAAASAGRDWQNTAEQRRRELADLRGEDFQFEQGRALPLQGETQPGTELDTEVEPEPELIPEPEEADEPESDESRRGDIPPELRQKIDNYRARKARSNRSKEPVKRDHRRDRYHRPRPGK